MKLRLLAVAPCLVLLFAGCIPSEKPVKVSVWHQPNEMPRSTDYSLRVNGIDVDVLECPKAEANVRQETTAPCSYAIFEADGEITVEVASSALDLRHAKVLPNRLGIRVETAAGKARFRLRPPMNVAFEPNGRQRALILCAMLPEIDPPKPSDKGVNYIAPGFHHRNVTQIGKGETLYLAKGAVLESGIAALGDDTRICGRGILLGKAWPRQRGPKEEGKYEKTFAWFTTVRDGKNCRVEDVTLMASYGWTLVLANLNGATVDNVKILGGRVLNDDGIDICETRNTTVRNSFIRTQDDCIAPKWWNENLVVTNCTLWADIANNIRIGAECSAPPKHTRNLQFRDIDVIHSSLDRKSGKEYWVNAVIDFWLCNGHHCENVTIENFEIHESAVDDQFLVIKSLPTVAPYKWNECGDLAGVIFRNVKMPRIDGGMKVWIEAHDPKHKIENIRFENVTGYDKVETFGPVSGLVGMKP